MDLQTRLRIEGLGLLDAFRRPGVLGARRRNAILSLDGTEFTDCLTRVARSHAGSHPRFAFEAESALYRVDDGHAHRFAHRSRLTYYLGGLATRGANIAEEYLLDHVPLADGDTIVDVGANVGDCSLGLQHLGIRASVIAVEPGPREYAALVQNLKANPAVTDHETHNIALWSENAGPMTFYLKSESADSSLIEIADYEEKIEVPTQRLDRLLERRPYKLLKLEAEGAEPEILDGAEGVLDCFDYITADVGFERGKRQDSTLPDVVRRLHARGFEVEAVFGRRLILLFRNMSGGRDRPRPRAGL